MKKFLIAALMFASNLMANELTLYFIPSPVGLDWTTPSTIAQSAFKNWISFKPHFMGHVFVEIKCGEKHELAGMIGQKPDYATQLILNQRGLAVLYHSFDGKLEHKQDVQNELTDYFKNGGLNFARFNLNEGQCKRASQYLDEYRQKNVGKYYGLANRPRHGEGAGCSAFGVSFMDVLNLVDQEMKESWSHTINIPMEFAGPPLNEEKVSLFKVMFNAGAWAKENEKHQKLTFWEPDRMYNWVNKKIAAKQSDYKILKIQNVEGVVYDKSHFPVPPEPIWLQQLDPKDSKKIIQN